MVLDLLLSQQKRKRYKEEAFICKVAKPVSHTSEEQHKSVFSPSTSFAHGCCLLVQPKETMCKTLYSGAPHSDVNPFQEKRHYPEMSLCRGETP